MERDPLVNREELDQDLEEAAVDDGPLETAEASGGQLEELRAQEAATRDQLLRARAELENQRKRSAREVEEARKFALQSFVRELLPVKDSLEKGLEAALGEAAGDAESLQQGIRLTLKLWQEVLAREGVEELDPLGQPFDPDLHEALTTRHSLDVPPHTVLEVMQKGYLLNGRLIRPARVVVAVGGDTGTA